MFALRHFSLVIFCSFCLLSTSDGQEPTDCKWINQLDSGDWGACYDVSADGKGNVYSTGFTVGTIDGVKAKASDAFLAKYDLNGKLVWGKLVGTNKLEESNGVVADADCIYITGSTQGKLGKSARGGFDMFVSKFDSAGTVLWTQQLGTEAGEQGESIAVDKQGNVLITGWTEGDLQGKNAGKDDAFIVKLDASGKLVWKTQFGTEGVDKGYGIATDSAGNVLVVGSTEGPLGGEYAGNGDAFVAKFDSKGKQLWIKQLGTKRIDFCNGIAVGSTGDLFISGHTQDVLGKKSQGGLDVFVARFSSAGNQKWIRQFGTPNADASFGLAIDNNGTLFIAGGTMGDMQGTNKGSRDAYLAVLDSTGADISTIQFGTSEYDCASGLAVGGSGNVFVVGETNGRFDRPGALDDSDGFTARLEIKSLSAQAPAEK